MTQPTAVRFFEPDHPAIATTARARTRMELDKDIADLRYADSWDDFNKRLGKITGLETALAVYEQAEKDIMEQSH